MQFQALSLGGWCASRDAAIARRCHIQARCRAACVVENLWIGERCRGGWPRTTVSQYSVEARARRASPLQWAMRRASARAACALSRVACALCCVTVDSVSVPPAAVVTTADETPASANRSPQAIIERRIRTPPVFACKSLTKRAGSALSGELTGKGKHRSVRLIAFEKSH